jgi:beta-glucosidase-like glycosyl hydrolase/CubicO group peptidase (beta-lactamase class C family)
MKKYSFSFLFICFSIVGFSQQINPLLTKDYQAQTKWVDSVYNSLSLQEKIGQLFMVDIFSSDPKEKVNKIKLLIKDYYIGGIIFSKGGPKRQIKLNNEFQSLSNVPLIMAMDAEWGLAMRLDSTYAFPFNMTLGAIKEDSIVEKIGHQIGLHTKRMGMHINFAPVVDINTNPKNPIIGSRSFGENKEMVTKKALAFMRGLQNAGVLANAKHFPGHGDTSTDSHKTLPTISFSKERIDSVELYPYKKLIPAGLGSVMVAHLNVPALEKQEGLPSSISKNIVTTILKGRLGFNGLIFTDALSMKGASNFKKPGEIDLAAFLAGNDMLLIPEDVPTAHKLFVNAYREGIISEKRLAHSVKKILQAKYKVGLKDYKPINPNHIIEDLNSPFNDVLYEEAIAHAVTLIQNNENLVPIKNLKDKTIAYVNLGDASGKTFYTISNKYTQVSWVKAKTKEAYLTKLKPYDYVIIGFHKPNTSPWDSYKFTQNEIAIIKAIAKEKKVILDVFAKPYALLDFKEFNEIEAILISYQNSDLSQSVSAQFIFGARPIQGELPVSIGENYPVGTSISTKSLNRLQYGTPESVGVSSEGLKAIDSIVKVGLSQKMMPGAQVTVARKGKVVYQKNFGYFTYNKKQRVKDNTIYDLASLTKILATLPIIMQLYDRGVITMDTTLGELLPELKDSNKAKITLKKMLSHYAQFKAWIPYYLHTVDSITKKPLAKYYAKKYSKEFKYKVAKDLYMRTDYKDSIYKLIKESDLREKDGYKYSDLPYYLLKKYIEDFYGTPFEEVLQRSIYKTLGANYTGFLPLKRFSVNQIPPTEEDTYFRHQTIRGYVHDQGAAMLGGVSGHAGLFSNANDVAKIMQMYLQKGNYGGIQYISSQTIDAFNTCYYCEEDIRRGVGFDKPQLGDVGPTCGCVSLTSFGHSGFTGTFTWADPEEAVVYVFLSNRTFPDASNRKIIKTNLRSNVQQAIYDAIDRYRYEKIMNYVPHK